MITARVITSVVAGVGVVGSGVGAGLAWAEAAPGSLVPLSSVYRLCDFSDSDYVNATGGASPRATIGSSGGTVTADVFMAIGVPDTAYQVRLIQGPRPGSQKCNAGDPGVVSAMLRTDGNGTGSLTLHDAIRPGATNAWVFIDGPPDRGEIRGEFYTSDVQTSLR